MNLPVKRVENHPGNHTGDQKYWSYSVDRRKISTFLAGVIPDIFAVRF